MDIEEYGTVTGRRRRVGLFDMDLAREILYDKRCHSDSFNLCRSFIS